MSSKSLTIITYEWLLNKECFTPKFIFDHLRNIGLSAILLAIGYALAFKTLNITSFLYIPGFIAGWFLLVIGTIITLINSLQFALVSVTSCPVINKKWILFIVVMAITVWSQILMYYVLYVQFFQLTQKI